MNKADLIERIYAEQGPRVSKAQAARALESVISGITAALKKGDRVITQSGLVGRLLSIEGRYAKLELPPSGTKVTILRSGLLGRDAEGDAGSSAAPEAGDKDKSKAGKTTAD